MANNYSEFSVLYALASDGTVRYNPDKEWSADTLEGIDEVLGGFFSEEELRRDGWLL